VHQTPLLLVDDMGDAVAAASWMVAYGPSAQSLPMNWTKRDSLIASDVALRRSRFGDPPPASPLLFADARLVAGARNDKVDQAQAVFDGLTFLLAWHILATTAQPTSGGIDLTIIGAREVHTMLNMAALDPSKVSDGQSALLDVYRWVAESTEVDRVYFVQQALSLALVTDKDVLTAPKPALRTARSLYDLSRRGLVTETMAARRSARESALSTSRGAATLARDTVGKATERALVQVVAVAAIVVAHVQDAFSKNEAGLLLLLVASLCAGSWAVNQFVTLKSAGEGLVSELDDLDQYRDSLSEDDVRAIREVGAIRVAKDDLRRARTSVFVTYLVATVAAVAAALIIWFVPAGANDSDTPGEPPSQTPSDSVGTNVPSGDANSPSSQTPDTAPTPPKSAGSQAASP
jgi:hypothetical protein